MPLLYITHHSHLPTGFPNSTLLLLFTLHSCSKEIATNRSWHSSTQKLSRAPHCVQHKILALAFQPNIQGCLPCGPHLTLELIHLQPTLPLTARTNILAFLKPSLHIPISFFYHTDLWPGISYSFYCSLFPTPHRSIIPHFWQEVPTSYQKSTVQRGSDKA